MRQSGDGKRGRLSPGEEAVRPNGNELIGLTEWIKIKDVQKPGKGFWVPNIGKGR